MFTAIREPFSLRGLSRRLQSSLQDFSEIICRPISWVPLPACPAVSSRRSDRLFSAAPPGLFNLRPKGTVENRSLLRNAMLSPIRATMPVLATPLGKDALHKSKYVRLIGRLVRRGIQTGKTLFRMYDVSLQPPSRFIYDRD